MKNISDLIKEAEKLAYKETEKYSTPILQHITLSRTKGAYLANCLGADKNVVDVGILMMDSKIGEAISLGKQTEHAVMSCEFTKELLSSYPDIPETVKRNIEACVLEHHGREKFHSLESEICCNADCFRFLSIEGVSYVLRYFRDMEYTDLITLINKKIDEKWDALSLEICKEELEPQYKILNDFMKYISLN